MLDMAGGLRRRRGSFALHPFAFSIYSVMALYASNLNEVAPLHIVRSLATTLIGTASLYLFLCLIIRERVRSSLIASVVVVLFFSYGKVYRLLRGTQSSVVAIGHHRYLVFLWLLLLGLSIWLILRRISQPETLSGFLSVVSAMALVVPLSAVVLHVVQAEARIETDIPVQMEVNQASRPPDGFPDIYYIILDGYARADVLREVFGYDNSGFLGYLGNLGFYVAEQSHSNYALTTFSLASSLNMSFLEEYSTTLGRDSTNVAPLEELIRHNRVIAFLKGYGYQFVTFSSGYRSSEIPGADVYLDSGQAGLNDFEMVLLTDSPAIFLLERVDFFRKSLPNQAQRHRFAYILKQLGEVPKLSGPKFVFAHVIAPHPPFLFGPNGEEVPLSKQGTMVDAGNILDTPEDYIEGYRDQLVYLNKLLEQTLGNILHNSPHLPIILLQADHGCRALVDWSTVHQSCPKAEMAILSAYFLPGMEHEFLYPSITPVNSFRVVLNAYFNTSLPLEPDVSYFSTWPRPYDFFDVSRELAQGRCAPP